MLIDCAKCRSYPTSNPSVSSPPRTSLIPRGSSRFWPLPGDSGKRRSGLPTCCIWEKELGLSSSSLLSETHLLAVQLSRQPVSFLPGPYLHSPFMQVSQIYSSVGLTLSTPLHGGLPLSLSGISKAFCFPCAQITSPTNCQDGSVHPL